MVKINDRWSALSMKDRADLINMYITNGISELKEMKKHYNGIPYRDLNTSDYDYFNASPEMIPTEEGQHWDSRNPHTGRLLKGENHPTFDLMVEGENKAGYKIVRGYNGELYSIPNTPDNYVENYNSFGEQFGKQIVNNRDKPSKKLGTLAYDVAQFHPILGTALDIADVVWAKERENALPEIMSTDGKILPLIDKIGKTSKVGMGTVFGKILQIPDMAFDAPKLIEDLNKPISEYSNGGNLSLFNNSFAPGGPIETDEYGYSTDTTPASINEDSKKTQQFFNAKNIDADFPEGAYVTMASDLVKQDFHNYLDMFKGFMEPYSKTNPKLYQEYLNLYNPINGYFGDIMAMSNLDEKTFNELNKLHDSNLEITKARDKYFLPSYTMETVENDYEERAREVGEYINSLYNTERATKYRKKAYDYARRKGADERFLNINKLDNIQINASPITASNVSYDDNLMTIGASEDITFPTATFDNALAHEILHSYGLLNTRKEDDILTDESPYYGNNYNYVSPKYKRLLSSIKPINSHDMELNEGFSFLGELRTDLYKRGIVDGRTEKYKKKHIKEFIKQSLDDSYDDNYYNAFLFRNTPYRNDPKNERVKYGRVKRALNKVWSEGGDLNTFDIGGDKDTWYKRLYSWVFNDDNTEETTPQENKYLTNDNYLDEVSKFISTFEEFYPNAYEDTHNGKNIWTVGSGLTYLIDDEGNEIKVKKGDTITKEENINQLNKRLQKNIDYVKSKTQYWDNYPAELKFQLLDAMYNIGAPKVWNPETNYIKAIMQYENEKGWENPEYDLKNIFQHADWNLNNKGWLGIRSRMRRNPQSINAEDFSKIYQNNYRDSLRTAYDLKFQNN